MEHWTKHIRIRAYITHLFFPMFCVRNMGKPSLQLLFRDLTQLGLPKSQFSLVSDETAYKYNPDRYNFYMQLLDDVADPNQKIASKVFGVLARTRRQHERIKEKIDSIAEAINYLKTTYTKPESIGKPREYGELAVLKNELNSRLKRMPIVGKEYEFDTDFEKAPITELQKGEIKEQEIPKQLIAEEQKTSENADKKQDAGGYEDGVTQDGGSWFGDKLKEFKQIDEANIKPNRAKEAAQDDVVLEYKNHPIYSPDNQNVTYTDRLIFVGITFMFRAISLFMIDWGINTKIIKGFQTGFFYYFMIYNLLFLIWVLLVNIRKQNVFFGMLFYYINANYDKTVWKRIIVHVALQLFILPVPLIVTDTTEKAGAENDTFDKRERMLNTLSLFTFIIWILTSLIALRA